MVEEKGDFGGFTIPCTIRVQDFARAFCDNGKGIKLPKEYACILVINEKQDIDDAQDIQIEESGLDEGLEAILVNYDVSSNMEGYEEVVKSLEGTEYYLYKPRELSLDLENRITHPAIPSIEEPT
ncbi:hypothetical protein HAX54_053527, partial [Datura stramonium]|nr:hypothetical protein [Datura stramonium]